MQHLNIIDYDHHHLLGDENVVAESEMQDALPSGQENRDLQKRCALLLLLSSLKMKPLRLRI